MEGEVSLDKRGTSPFTCHAHPSQLYMPHPHPPSYPAHLFEPCLLVLGEGV